MSWGDLNGDGRSDFVDQKIFDTQINPYSGEYQGNTPSYGGGGSGGGLLVTIAALIFCIVLFAAVPTLGISIGVVVLIALLSTKKDQAKANKRKYGSYVPPVYPIASEESNEVTCPECYKKQKVGNRRCENCGVPFFVDKE